METLSYRIPGIVDRIECEVSQAMDRRCERCGENPEHDDLHDYCAQCCRQNLCPSCMAEGCCGTVPAESGNDLDYADQDTEAESEGVMGCKKAWKPGWYGWDTLSEDAMAWGPAATEMEARSHPSLDAPRNDLAIATFLVVDPADVMAKDARVAELEARVRELEGGAMDRRCEKCGEDPEEHDDLHDYCAQCSQNLCAKCMAEGCCGTVPAESGNDFDYDDPDTEPEPEGGPNDG